MVLSQRQARARAATKVIILLGVLFAVGVLGLAPMFRPGSTQVSPATGGSWRGGLAQGPDPAAPIIDSIAGGGVTILPGGTASLRINARTPRDQVVQVYAIVTDSAGRSVEETTFITIAEPLTYAMRVDVGSIAQHPLDPMFFTYKAP